MLPALATQVQFAIPDSNELAVQQLISIDNKKQAGACAPAG
jgi:hypothetical protein